MLLKGIILVCCDRLSDERTDSAIYHILTGKRSVQTVQDIHLYQLTTYYNIHKKLDREVYNRILNELNEEGFLIRDQAYSTLQLTTKGKMWLHDKKDQYPIHYFNGLKFKDTADMFLDRLTLVIQTFSNVGMKRFSFIPVVDNHLAESWVKEQYNLNKARIPSYLRDLHSELFHLLLELKEKEATIFVDRLSGHQYYGMSWEQLANSYDMIMEDVQLLLTGISHQMCSKIMDKEVTFPLLYNMIMEGSKKRLLTDSAFKTFQLLEKQYSIENIALVRNLRVNTIQDHLVEIALYQEDFPIQNYVPAATQKDILMAIQKATSNKLKEIKALTEKETTYFQIRLFMAGYEQAGEKNVHI
ncbi:helix-turn-helix domain-containing protein [Oceanobacillus manasiensis]|uniref:helix-turn-helix domain-containing protein n=1 Tax=Oceanobacillus manasiensis TaxID=586413 RepID=UPI0005A6D560|nr:helix-turn-helix domain-containing protein [Oceanobacillus manasiensis]